jgi:hypothetical protein
MGTREEGLRRGGFGDLTGANDTDSMILVSEKVTLDISASNDRSGFADRHVSTQL